MPLPFDKTILRSDDGSAGIGMMLKDNTSRLQIREYKLKLFKEKKEKMKRKRKMRQLAKDEPKMHALIWCNSRICINIKKCC